jgi:hypothetical protein
MDGMSRRRLTYANVMSTLAVFIALGGSSFAAVKLAKNSVSSVNIKNGEVKRADLASNAVNGAKVADGSLLAADFQAGQLPAGPTGLQGPKGDAGATNVKVHAATGNHYATVECPAGERATGGGAHSFEGYVVGEAPTNNPLALETKDGITVQDYTPNAWSAAAEDGSGGPSDVTVWIVCASP